MAELLNFQYKGISEGKYVEGEIEAINNSEAAHKLKEQKIIITKLLQAKKKIVKEKKKKGSGFSFGNSVKAEHILVFCKQFSTMQRAGLPVLETLKLLEKQTTAKGMQKILGRLEFRIDVSSSGFEFTTSLNASTAERSSYYETSDYWRRSPSNLVV